MAKYAIVLGSVVSGVGKGISCSSIGLLMKLRGHTIQIMKFDPYLNVNAGIINPIDHGEVWVCDDASETDLDLGSYERITHIEVSKQNICTNGQIYKELIEEQEEGIYLGQTIQMVPHVTNKIKNKFSKIGESCDLALIEIGGTIDDIESYPILESIRQFKQDNPNDVIVILVSPILWMPTIKEFKTKPLQNSVKSLYAFGIQPDILICRTTEQIPGKLLEKIAIATNINRECIFDAPDVSSIYCVPIEFYNRHIDDTVSDLLQLKRKSCRIYKYRELVEKYTNNQNLPNIKIGVVCKYWNCDEAYLSLKEAIYHAGANNDVKVEIMWINAEEVEKEDDFNYKLDGLIVPGGFDVRGVLGKIKAIQYARENNLPFLGICLGLQCAVIEFCRNVLGIENANSLEFDKKCKNPVVHLVEGQDKITKKSATMRLGAYDCELDKESKAYDIYHKKIISERHRHRYEVNDEYTAKMAEKGFKVSGRNPESNLVEIMELDNHPFFIGTQAHPEFKSRLGEPSPLFDALVKVAIKK